MTMAELNISNDDPCLKIVLKGHRKPVTDISFHPSADTNQFASSSEDTSLMIWNLKKNSRSYNFTGHTNTVTGVEYSHDGRLLASCSIDNTVRFWIPTVRGDCSEFKGHLSPIQCMNFSPDSNKLITGGRDKSIKLWDVQTKRFICSFLGHNAWLRCVKYFPNEKLIVSCSDDRTVRIWDVASAQCIHSFVGNEGSPVHVAAHQNCNSIAVAMSSGAVRVYEIKTKKLQQHYTIHDSTTYVAWHPSANYLLTCGKEGKIRIIDVMEGRPIYTVGGHEGSVNCVKFSNDGTYFGSGGDDNNVMVWKTNFIH